MAQGAFRAILLAGSGRSTRAVAGRKHWNFNIRFEQPDFLLTETGRRLGVSTSAIAESLSRAAKARVRVVKSVPIDTYHSLGKQVLITTNERRFMAESLWFIFFR